jgi:hypothetical protein
MPAPIRVLARAATKICTALDRRRLVAPQLPAAEWQDCEVRLERMMLARRRGWTDDGVSELAGALSDVARRCELLRGDLLRRRDVRPPTHRDVLADLVGLADCFPAVEVDLRYRELSVVTEPIELDGVRLGPFAVVLPWDGLGDESPEYFVKALDPRPAATDESVVHPHVSDERLCEGEGRAPLRRALAEGRLLDFFVIVAQVLRTYNDASAYVALDRWDGVSCASCGDAAPSACRRCDDPVCDECSSACSSCDVTLCSGCSEVCPRCERDCCSSCLNPCESCHEPRCHCCLEDCCPADDDEPADELGDDELGDDELGDQPDDAEDDRHKKTAPCAIDLAVQPVGLGQTVVPA